MTDPKLLLLINKVSTTPLTENDISVTVAPVAPGVNADGTRYNTLATIVSVQGAPCSGTTELKYYRPTLTEWVADVSENVTASYPISKSITYSEMTSIIQDILTGCCVDFTEFDMESFKGNFLLRPSGIRTLNQTLIHDGMVDMVVSPYPSSQLWSDGTTLTFTVNDL